MGIERFISPQRAPAMMWSVNGTDIVGAEMELSANIKQGSFKNINAEVAHKDIKWRFNPSSGSRRGNMHLRKACLQFQALTLHYPWKMSPFCLVEHLHNKRPLTPVSTNSFNLEALTSNNFCSLTKEKVSFTLLAQMISITVSSTHAHHLSLTLFSQVGSKSSSWH